MSQERIEGKERKEYGKAEEKIGNQREKEGYASGPTGPTTGYVCEACGDSFAAAEERVRHNELVHGTM
jgi:hypothetical protein